MRNVNWMGLVTLAVVSSCCIALGVGAPARAQEPAESTPASSAEVAADTATDPVAAPAPAPGKWLAHFNVALMLAQWKGELGGQAAGWTHVGQRQSLLQFVGLGYFIAPQWRITASLQFVETLGGRKPGESAFTAANVVVWAAYHPLKWLFFGLGPLVAPRAYGKWQWDAGIFSAVGVAFPLGSGVALGGAVQVPFTFVVRPAVAVSAVAFLSYRF